MSFNREKLKQQFLKAYRELNPRQQLAVDTIEGPVMVIAGPGTGKTQILASRVGKILLDTDVLPDNILCLTYTDAGVVAMRKRLLQFIGPDAYKVNIFTFHAFCNEVIQENLAQFEKTEMDPVSDLERIEILQELIDSLPKNHPLKHYRSNPYFEIKNLQALFSNIKREGWSPAFINQKIDEYLSTLPSRGEFVYKRKGRNYEIGDLKTERIEEETEKMEKLRAAVNEFARFEAIMRRRNRYDFDDMINWVIRAFEENKNLLAKYQERFQYVLIDEYQDTSGTQNRLVELLISYWDKPNVFVVGDDDQSIYRFQGANVENMMQFARSYHASLLKVVLTNNYRSTQPILDISKILIERNNERLVNHLPGLDKNLVSSNARLSAASNPPIVREYDTQRHEMVHIISQLQQLLEEGVQPGRIAVIYRENKYGEELSRYMRFANIPVYSKRFVNILELPLVQKIILLLNWLAAEHEAPYSGDEMLFEILHFDWFNIPPIDIARLSVEVAESRSGSNPVKLRRLLYTKINTPPKDLFSQPVNSRLSKAGTILERLMSEASNVTLQQLFDVIVRETGVLHRIMQSEEKHWQLQVLTTLFDFIKEETRRNPFLDLRELVKIFRLMRQEDIPLQVMQISGNDKGVNLLTAHGSKGLEFEYVFFAGCNNFFWEKKKKPFGGFTFPDTMFESQPKHSETEELRRLFYVAITRAERHLYISYFKLRNDGREAEPSMFIAEILDRYALPVEKGIVSDEALAALSVMEYSKNEVPQIEKIEEDFITRLLDKFVLSATALNYYLRCPLEFYFKSLIRIPSAKNETLEFGLAVHYAMEQLFRKMQANEERFPGKPEFISDFESHMKRHRESFTREQFARRMEYGQEVLANYYDAHIDRFNKVVSVERNFRNVVNGVPLKGKTDKLEFEGNIVNVVDYKTGDADKGRDKLKPPSEKNPVGGDYWRQAVFYKILVEGDRKPWRVGSAEFDFIEPTRKKTYSRDRIAISPEDVTTVMHQVTDTWQKIQNREFYTGCGNEKCHWCNFVKTNNLAIAYQELEEEQTEQ